MTFDELNKFDLGYNGFTDFEAGQQSRQVEIDEIKWLLKNANGQADDFCKKSIELQKQINDALKQRDSFIKAHNIAMNDVLNLKAERDALQEAVNREREQATEYYTDFHCAVAERDALQKQIDLIVDLVHDQTIDYFLDNLIQDILKGDKND